MTVPFNDVRRRFATSRYQILSAWADLVDQGSYVGDPSIEEFEQLFAEYCGAPYCMALANGTDALELALRAVNVRLGDEVITVANAGGYTSAACYAIGATPIYVDVEQATCQLDLVDIKRVLSNKTRAIVVTHLYGFMNNIVAVRACLASLGREDLAVIEDCAQAHGAVLNDCVSGSLGDVAAFSFYPTKNLGAIGDAGAVLCRNSEVANRIRQLRQYGWDSKYRVMLPGGRNSRMDPLQAIVLSQQLSSLVNANATRRKICNAYASNLPFGWKLVGLDDPRFVGHLAVAIAPSETAREHACQVLSKREIGHHVHYPILDCDQPAWQDQAADPGDLPQSRLLTKKILSLPCFPEMSSNELEQVVNAIRAFY